MHIIPLFLVIMVGIYLMGSATTGIAIVVIIVLVFFIITFFLSYHLSKVDALLSATYVFEAIHEGDLVEVPRVISVTYEEDMMYYYEKRSFWDILCS